MYQTALDHTLPFAQYLRPNGRKSAVNAPCTKEIYDLGNTFLDKGGKYEVEVLTTGHISMTASYVVKGEPQDIAIEICDNNEAVHTALEKLVKSSVDYIKR